MTRRTFLGAAAGAAVLSAAPPGTRLGVATTCYLSYWRPSDTLQFLEHCHGLGAAGIQAPLTSLDPEYLKRLERRLKDLGMFFEVISPMPQADTSRYVATLEAAKSVGATAVRSACLSGRRYETFKTLADWQTFVSNSKAAIARAVPIVERLKLPLGIENHKDWTVDDFVAILKQYSSPYVGVCLDTGNNMSLLDDPYEAVERLAPYAVTSHVKDMGVQSYRDGFLLSEVVLGTGCLDMKRIVSTLRNAKPNLRLNLEMITRDPLRVPCLTDAYWVTFHDRGGSHLARMLRFVRDHSSSLPSFSQMTKDEQLAAENDNVKRCLAVGV